MALKDKFRGVSATQAPSKDYRGFAIQKYPDDIGAFYFMWAHKNKRIINRKKTKITSIGSCFAQNISHYLKKHGYQYIVTEKNQYGFSANWGIVFNSSSIRQIFEHSFGLFHPKIKWWERTSGMMQDPYRRNTIISKANNEHELNRKKHLKASKQAIIKANVIVATLGLTEVWRDKRDKTVFWRVPPLHLYHPEIYEFHLMTVHEVYNDLVRIKEIIDKNNPGCHLIVTVSPVPLQATYREDCDVLSANVYSKAVSCVAANQFVSEYKDRNVNYFPSFEYVRYGFDNPYIADGRHIKPEVVAKMMTFFEKMFCGVM